jgi:glutamyl-tRNA synthetase
VKYLVVESDLEAIIRKFALQNALVHHGKANAKAVLGKILGENQELRGSVKELMPVVNIIVDQINSISETEIKAELESLAPELLQKDKQKKELILPDLPNLDKFEQVVMRFAPGPSGPLHIGHSRAIIVNDEYVKRYSGKLILRFEDTNPHNIEPTAYDMIPEDLAWLDVKYHESYRQSDRFNEYYKWVEELLKQEHAYVCICPVDDWRRLKENQAPCPDRTIPANEHLERWQKMLGREYSPGEVSLVIKTDLSHPNPAVRDFVGMRIVAEEHPITGDKYYVYPTYNLSVAIDDHLMGITHILRGKDHLNNTHRQKYIYDYLGWQKPEFLHYGWVSLKDIILKTTTIKNGINRGEYSGWSDIQLGTLQALSNRGIQPEAIRKYWLDVGIKEVDIEFSWQTLFALNKEIIDKNSNRYFFVWEPIILKIIGVERLESRAPLHPDDPSRGIRETVLQVNQDDPEMEKDISVFISKEDLENAEPGMKFRLKDLCNIEITKLDLKNKCYAKYIGNDLSIIKEGAKIIHWVSVTDNYPAEIYMPDGKVIKGFCEILVKDSLSKTVQFERFGFVRLGSTEIPPVLGWFTHK